MNALEKLSTGIQSYSEALQFIRKHKLYIFFLFPFMLSLLLGYFLFSSIAALSDYAVEWLLGMLPTDSENMFIGWLLTSLEWILWILFKIFAFIIFAYVGGYVIIILLSPVFAYLSEKTEQILSGKEYPFSWKQFSNDMLRGIQVSLKNFINEMVWLLILSLLAFVPVVNIAAPFIMFIISAYYYGFSFIDYSFERRKFNAKESGKIIYQNKEIITGVGFVFSLILLIPVLGTFIAGFFAVISVVAAELSFKKLKIEAQ